MRLLLVVNARAGTVTPRTVRFIERALSDQAKVQIELTRGPGHAAELAREAAAGDHDVVAVMGGDGTVNEVANGLAGSDVPIAIIPGGGTNVLARSLGIPQEPIRAAGFLLARLGGPARRIPLGRAADRYFTFSCGIGLDGEIVRRVERRQHLKRAAGHGYFVWTALRAGLVSYDFRTPRIRARWGPDLEHERDGLTFLIAQSCDPYSYLGHLPIRVCPRASLDLGLDAFAGGPVSRLRVVRWALKTMGSGRHALDRRALSLHDQERIEVTAASPHPVQMDGEYVGRHDRLLLESVPGALAILA
ncbi:MAG TPA: diacylglycerol kinase family protein [Actinomycetota bacterium]|nr:diacylglycerol kinase family protein [Actinomycetota bacterium]